PDLPVLQPELARVGVQHREPVPGPEVLDQAPLLVDPLELVLGLDEAHGPSGPSERLQVSAQLAEEQLARVGKPLDPEYAILLQEQRHDRLAYHLLDRWHQVQSTDSGEVRLDELEGVLPHRASVVHQRVE